MAATMQRDLTDGHTTINGTANGTTTSNGTAVEEVDAIVVGAGFAGVYLLYKLRKAGFTAKIIEAGSGLGGIWHWNSYPGARVDSQYPTYSLSLPEVYEDWTWSSHYPDHVELRQYFEHVDKKVQIKKDTVFNAKVVSAEFDESTDKWSVLCDTGKKFRCSFFIASIGFAAKRYFPDWEGLDSYEGVIHHSSFWPHDGVDVKGKKVAVVGTGATGIQITQEWAKEVGENGDLKMFQRTPNFCCPMRQKFLTAEQNAKDKEDFPALYNERLNNFNGFLYQFRPMKMYDHTPEERQALFEELWGLGGFRFLMNNYMDMTRDVDPNKHAYAFWRDKVRQRINDPETRELLAPMEAPHPFGAKRLSLEQDLYEQFNRPNIHVVDMKKNPIKKFVHNGIVQEDGTFHELDAIALATGFDSITGGLKDIEVKGLGGEILSEKWAKGTWTYLGMMTSRFPNFFFTYGPQGPTAFSNGPTCVELQGDWMVELFDQMRKQGKTRVDPTSESEENWRVEVNELSKRGLRHHTDNWYNGANIPGKPREPLNYAGGIPQYMKTIDQVRDQGYKGFELK